MPKFRVEFDIGIFIEGWQSTMLRYFRGELSAAEAARRLGITRGQWNDYMGGIFSSALAANTSIASIEEIGPPKMIVKCPQCGREYEAELEPRSSDGKQSIQEIYPDALPYQREQLQTGICSDRCWDEYLKPEQETAAVYDENGKWVSGGWRAE